MNHIFFLIVTIIPILFLGIIGITPFASADTYAYTVGTELVVRTTAADTGTSCPTGSGFQFDGAAQNDIQLGDSGLSQYCTIASYEWDISSIPSPGYTAIITDVLIRYDVTMITTPKPCDWNSIEVQPSINTAATMWTDIQDGTTFVGSDAGCQSVSNDKSLDLTSSANTDLQNNLEAGWWAVGIKFDTMTRDAGIDRVEFGDVELQVTYSLIPNPDAVDDTASTDIGNTSVDLIWSEPNLNTGNLTGYMINYTTPWTDNPNTIITNNTENSDVTTQVSGLSESTPYSFRIGVWTEGFNGTGNVLNITTLEDFTLANFTPGFFDLNATNEDIIQIFFERQDINSTALFLNVTYPNTYNLSCDFSYQFANINQTYSNLSNVTISSNAVESSFQFVDVDNEIIDVYCWNENNLDNDGSYIITQTSFPLLDQIANFRNGTYGTSGMFGAMDLITMAVVIISMIGFNRVNESVGAIFNIILLGSFAYFEIIELPTIIFGAIAVILMLVITTTRKT